MSVCCLRTTRECGVEWHKGRMYLSKVENVFAPIVKCICAICRTCLYVARGQLRNVVSSGFKGGREQKQLQTSWRSSCSHLVDCPTQLIHIFGFIFVNIQKRKKYILALILLSYRQIVSVFIIVGLTIVNVDKVFAK